MDYLRIWADDAGESHLEAVTLPAREIAAEPGVAPLTVSAPVPVHHVGICTAAATSRCIESQVRSGCSSSRSTTTDYSRRGL